MNKIAEVMVELINIVKEGIANLIRGIKDVIRDMYNRIIKTYTWTEENENEDQKAWADNSVTSRSKKNRQNKQNQKENIKKANNNIGMDWTSNDMQDVLENNGSTNGKAEELDPIEFEFDKDKQMLVATIFVNRLELQTVETHTVSADDYMEIVTTDNKKGIVSEIKLKNGDNEQKVAITANHVVGLINPHGKRVGRESNMATGANWVKVNHFVCCSVRVRHIVTYIRKGDRVNILAKTDKDPIMCITKVSSVLKAQHHGGLKTVGITISLSTPDAEKMMSGCVCMTERLAAFVIVMGITLPDDRGTHFLAVPLDPKIPKYDVKMVEDDAKIQQKTV